jgi:hypothetical protein
MLLPLMHYLSTLVMGVLLLWGAWREHLKWTLTTVALLIVVQPFMPVVFYGSNIWSMEPFYLSINLVMVYTLLWGTWTKNLKWSLTIVGLLLILQQRTVFALLHPYIFSSAVHDLGRFISLIAPLAIGIVLIWGAWTNHLKWSLIIVGAAISITSLIALIPTIIA